MATTGPALLLLSGDIDSANRHFADQPPAGEGGRRYARSAAGPDTIGSRSGGLGTRVCDEYSKYTRDREIEKCYWC